MTEKDKNFNLKLSEKKADRPRVSLANIVENRRVTRTKSDDTIMKKIIEKANLTKSETDEEDEFDKGGISINVKGAGTKIDIEKTNEHPRISTVAGTKHKKQN